MIGTFPVGTCPLATVCADDTPVSTTGVWIHYCKPKRDWLDHPEVVSPWQLIPKVVSSWQEIEPEVGPVVPCSTDPFGGK